MLTLPWAYERQGVEKPQLGTWGGMEASGRRGEGPGRGRAGEGKGRRGEGPGRGRAGEGKGRRGEGPEPS